MIDILINKKRILFIVPLPPPYAGPEISSKHLINSSLREQFEIIHLASNLHRQNSQKGRITIGSLAGLFLLVLRIVHKLITERPAAGYTLLSQNVSGFIRDSLLVLIIKAFRKKIVLHFRGSNFHNFYDNQPAMFKRYIRAILNLSDVVIVQAQWIKNIFMELIPEERLRVIYNGIPREAVFGRNAYPDSYSNNGIKVLYLNHLSVTKGLSVLLTAMQDIISEREGIDFIIAGDIVDNEKNIFFDRYGNRIVFEDIRSRIKDAAKNKGFPNRIRFLGEVADEEQKRQILKTASIFVLPSYSEGCPLSVLEAMAAGLPVVSTPVGALPEIIKEGENGLFLKMGDAKDLKDKIYYLAANPGLREAMGENNRKLIETKLNLDIVVSQLCDIFRNL